MSTPSKFTKKAQDALNKSLQYARELGHTYIGSEHILLGLCFDSECISAKILKSHKVNYENVRESVLEISGLGIHSNVSPSELTPRARHIIEDSNSFAKRYRNKFIGTEHILLALLYIEESVSVKILESMSVSIIDLRKEIEDFLESVSENGEEKASNSGNYHDKNKNIESKIMGCPTISEFGRNLVEMVKEDRIDPTIGRDGEIERVIQILSRRTKNNPCLIGEPGVGKTAVVEGLARRISNGEVPQMLKSKIIVTLDIPAMIAGAKYRGEFEERMKNVMRESAKNKDVILFIDEFHTIIGAGSAEGALDAANIIKPALARGEMQIIGATTLTEYHRHIEKDSALERRFQSVNIEEPSEEDTLQILKGLEEKYEKHHNLKISEEAMIAAVELSKRYINDRFLPDKAIDLIDEAASRICMDIYTFPPKLKESESKLKKIRAEKEKAIISQNFEKAAKLRDEEEKAKIKYESAKTIWSKRNNDSNPVVTEEDVANVVTQWTNIPVNKLMESENEKLSNLEDKLCKYVVGQKDAIKSVSNAIKRGRIGISNPDKPIGSFIFVGPSGVGKTELCKALALILFGSKDALIRFDMSEYMEKHSVSKLIGSPPGYVGYGEGGLLTEKIRKRPYSLVLFDEIEKADSEIFNIFLQILDEGVLTDSQGRKVNFKNSLIIMTSNLGSGHGIKTSKIGFSIQNLTEREKETVKENIENELKKTFSPEFLNRVDEIITFNALTNEDIELITMNTLKDFTSRLAKRNFKVNIDESAVKLIAKKGSDEGNGARPIKRAIVKMVENKFANDLINKEINEGDELIICGIEGEIVFKKAKS